MSGYRSLRRIATHYATWYKALNGLPLEYDEQQEYKKNINENNRSRNNGCNDSAGSHR